MTEKMTIACFMRLSIRPNMSTREKGKIIIARVLKKLEMSVGFSKGCAEFMP